MSSDAPAAAACPPDAGRRRLLTAAVIGLVASLPAVAGAAIADAGTAAPAGAGTRAPRVADWQSVLRAMFPHARVDVALYAVPAGALVDAAAADPATGALLAAGWQRLDAAAGGGWEQASAESRLQALATIAGTPLFTLLRQTVVFTFYGNPGVWAALGYEGDAWSFGGWLARGLDSIDWIPAPPDDGARPP